MQSGYRILEKGEIICAGDEFESLSQPGLWKPVQRLTGYAVNRLIVRRPVADMAHLRPVPAHLGPNYRLLDPEEKPTWGDQYWDSTAGPHGEGMWRGVPVGWFESRTGTSQIRRAIAVAAPPPEKPPLGLMPRKIHNELRQQGVRGAIERYLEAGKPVPVAWIEEWNDHCVFIGE